MKKYIQLPKSELSWLFYFLSHPNFHYTDMQLIPLELIHSSRDSIWKGRESFLIDLAGILEPHGLNRRDELWSM